MENAWTTIEVESRVRDPRVISHRRGGILVRARFVVPLALATVSRYKTDKRRGVEGENEERGLTSGRLVGSFKAGREIVSRRNFSEEYTLSRCLSMLVLQL